MSPLELREILKMAHEIVANPARWTERNFAEDEQGRWAPVGSQKAVRFNLAGAMIKSSGTSSRAAMQAFAELTCLAPAELDVEQWRHARGLTRSHALALLEWAIQRLEGVGRKEGFAANVHTARGPRSQDMVEEPR